MMMNLRQMEIFRAIMLTGSISAAAKLLHVSQPAVSRLIAYTEQRIGLVLFKRIKGRLYPTPEADRLFIEIRTLFQSVERVNEVAEDLVEQRIGHLRIACSSNLGQSLLPKAIKAFSDKHPLPHIIMHTSAPQVMLQELLSQQVELGVAFLPISHPNLESVRLYENRIIAILPKGHKLSEKPVLQIADFLGESLIGYCSDIPFGGLVRQMFDNARQLSCAKIEVQQVHVACALVEAGLGVALVDEQTVANSNWTNLVARPIEPAMSAPVHVFWRLYTPLSRNAQTFIEILRNI